MKKNINIAVVGLGQIGNYLLNELNLKKRDIELKRIVRDLWKMKHNHDNNIQMIVYDYLYMKVRQMQNK